MVETVERSKRFPMIGFHAIKEHPDLTWILGANISIGYLESDRAKKKNGRACLAECIKVSATYKAFVPHDFLIVVYMPNVDGMTERQLEILMYHELLHVGMTEDGEDVKYIVNPHDVEEFRTIIDRYGIDWAMH